MTAFPGHAGRDWLRPFTFIRGWRLVARIGSVVFT